MLAKAKATGVLDQETLKKTPGYNIEALESKKGSLVMIECVEKIPCNPCETVCPHDAIKVGNNITNLPVVIPEKCNGCGMCVAVCPGLAIFLVNANYAEGRAAVTFAYEYLPIPEKGTEVKATDREGNVVCSAIVEKMVNTKSYDQTRVVTISIPAEYANVVRGIKRIPEDK